MKQFVLRFGYAHNGSMGPIGSGHKVDTFNAYTSKSLLVPCFTLRMLRKGRHKGSPLYDMLPHAVSLLHC